jgi:ABC-type dipeptide/oligopeptide/nickel transport system permease component
MRHHALFLYIFPAEFLGILMRHVLVTVFALGGVGHLFSDAINQERGNTIVNG